MKHFKTSACAAAIFMACAAGSTSALAHEVGDWVLAPWQDSDQTFPGVVTATSGNAVTIRFDDGTKETRIASEVRAFNWRAGSKVECRWTDGHWYAATIRSLAADGYTMQVRYDDDGVIQNTNTGKCRSAN
jgi:hypothetical protein